MLKKDRQAITEIISNRLVDLSDNYTGYAVRANCEIIAHELANYIIIDNPYFNKKEFLNNCGITG